MLSAAVGTGVASNFGAPIGGVLFAIEVTATYFPVRNYIFAFIGSISGAISFRYFWNLIVHQPGLTPLMETDFSINFNSFSFVEYVLVAFLGVMCGLIGVAFIKFNALASRFMRKTKLRVFRSPYIYAFGVCLVCGVATYPLFFGDWMSAPQADVLKDLFHHKPLTSTDDPRIINKDWTRINLYGALVVYGVYKFLLTSVAILLPIPCGVYIPVMGVGACLGRIFGELLKLFFDGGGMDWANVVVIPGAYAVVGASALAGSVTHTLSSAVIIFELTGDIRFLLPVLLAVVISVATAKKLSSLSIYDSTARIRGLNLLPDIQQETYDVLAKDIMDVNAHHISRRTSFKDAVELINSTTDLVYAVVESEDSKILIGSITRESLQASLANATERKEEALFLDFPVESNPVQLVEDTPLPQIHVFFSTMMVPVAFVTRRGALVGVITRHDLSMIVTKKDSDETILKD
eukprot:TRINITY_DN5621_c0_g1_i1.p1 TRINITY_DN5621_c0_g1~~TRINITY_DN5621_c0_g1_i1.p1  ORF type:complete len:463 (-),score=105.18 TRINITY_DN5621_c0_g1_i1:11-1399(-)